MEELKPHLAAKTLQDFFLNDLSRWYGQIIRDDIKPDSESENKQVILNTFYKVMLETLKLMSPFVPFITESLYQDFFKKFEKEESIHFSDWPGMEKKYQDKELEEGMEVVKKIVEASNSIRHEQGIKLRYKLESLTVDLGKTTAATKKLNAIIGNMANIKEVKFAELEKGKEVEGMKISLNTKATPELKEDWMLSELTRKVQSKRKEMGLNIRDKIKLYLPEDDVLEKNKKRIEAATGSKVEFGEITGKKFEFVFEEKKYEFGIKI